MSSIVIAQEQQDLAGLLADLYRRMAAEDRGNAGTVAALLRQSAGAFERLAEDAEARHGA